MTKLNDNRFDPIITLFSSATKTTKYAKKNKKNQHG
jgi:hypothetical protein